MGEIFDSQWMIVKGHWSPTWRSLVLGIREVVVLGTRWIFGDGRRVRFWKDNWLLNEPLYESSIVYIPEEILEAKARDLWQNGTGWLLQVLEPYLSTYHQMSLALVVIDDVTGGTDIMSWNGSKDWSIFGQVRLCAFDKRCRTKTEHGSSV